MARSYEELVAYVVEQNRAHTKAACYHELEEMFSTAMRNGIFSYNYVMETLKELNAEAFRQQEQIFQDLVDAPPHASAAQQGGAMSGDTGWDLRKSDSLRKAVGM